MYGIQSEYIPMLWADGESFKLKQRRILNRIDELHEQGYKVSLVGTSAGGGAGLNVFALATDKLHTAVFICGTLGGAEYYSNDTYRKNPAFRESMQLVPGSLNKLDDNQKQRILAIQPLFDAIVQPRFAHMPGGKNRRMFTAGHVFSIGYAITLGMPKTVRFIKRTK